MEACNAARAEDADVLRMHESYKTYSPSSASTRYEGPLYCSGSWGGFSGSGSRELPNKAGVPRPGSTACTATDGLGTAGRGNVRMRCRSRSLNSSSLGTQRKKPSSTVDPVGRKSSFVFRLAVIVEERGRLLRFTRNTKDPLWIQLGGSLLLCSV